MAVLRDELIGLRSTDDIIKARQLVRDCAVFAGPLAGRSNQIVTAASELARNTLVHGGGGEMCLQAVHEGTRRGVQVTFTDQGPGIADVELAMTDGYTTRGGLGLGLSGSKRLVNEFAIESKPGKGTTVRIVRWK